MSAVYIGPESIGPESTRKMIGSPEASVFCQDSLYIDCGVMQMKGILVVKKNPVIIGLIRFLLTTFGYEIKKTPEIRKKPVIALIANTMSGDEDKFLKAGCSGYSSKSTDIGRSGSILDSYMGGYQVL